MTERQVPDMAVDVPMPDMFDEDATAEYFGRRIGQELTAVMFSMNYLSEIDDNADLAKRLDPRHFTQSPAPTALLDGANRAELGSWAKECARQLTDIRPSDAPGIVGRILATGHGWAKNSGYDPQAHQWLAGAGLLLVELCPQHHVRDAIEVIDTFHAGMLKQAVPSNEEMAQRYPVAAIHVAAAMTGWLYSQPACVPDQIAVKSDLLAKAQEILN